MAKTYIAIHPILDQRPPDEARYVKRGKRITFEDDAEGHVTELLRMGFIRPETSEEAALRAGIPPHLRPGRPEMLAEKVLFWVEPEEEKS